MRSLLEDPRPAAGTPTSLPRRRAPQEGAPKSVEKLPFLKSCGQDDGAEGTTADDGQRVEQAARTDEQRARTSSADGTTADDGQRVEQAARPEDQRTRPSSADGTTRAAGQTPSRRVTGAESLSVPPLPGSPERPPGPPGPPSRPPPASPPVGIAEAS